MTTKFVNRWYSMEVGRLYSQKYIPWLKPNTFYLLTQIRVNEKSNIIKFTFLGSKGIGTIPFMKDSDPSKHWEIVQ